MHVDQPFLESQSCIANIPGYRQMSVLQRFAPETQGFTSQAFTTHVLRLFLLEVTDRRADFPAIDHHAAFAYLQLL